MEFQCERELGEKPLGIIIGITVDFSQLSYMASHSCSLYEIQGNGERCNEKLCFGNRNNLRKNAGDIIWCCRIDGAGVVDRK